jgi:NADP-dependent aldehyde dehydrogenase
VTTENVARDRSGFYSVEALTGQTFGDPFHVHNEADVARACEAAEAAFDEYRTKHGNDRARFLDRIAAEILAIGDDLIIAAMRESGLPRARLEGERNRTVAQLRLFAEVVRAGRFLGLRVDSALPERQPPRPGLQLRWIPLGPVAIFGASNFPLAFSTAGGDTAAALAAGCPVVVRGHPAHPSTGALVAGAIERAVAACEMPKGVFSHLVGPEYRLGEVLVKDPRIAAVGFTGSRQGGLALMKFAQERPAPIPVYAEMSSINPVILFPAALSSRAEELANGFVASLTQGAGQFCTNPGLVIAIEGDGLETFIATAVAALQASAATTMLTPAICSAYAAGVEALANKTAVRTLVRSNTDDKTKTNPALFAADATTFLSDEALQQELFGASSLLIRCRDEKELVSVLKDIEGQLTATLHLDKADAPLARRLLPLLERKVGRILANGWPTGVEVTHAMVHGGPYPATSDARTTSVGTLAIERFMRPVCYQNLPADLLPADFFDDNVPRLIDGKSA